MARECLKRKRAEGMTNTLLTFDINNPDTWKFNAEFVEAAKTMWNNREADKRKKEQEETIRLVTLTTNTALQPVLELVNQLASKMNAQPVVQQGHSLHVGEEPVSKRQKMTHAREEEEPSEFEDDAAVLKLVEAVLGEEEEKRIKAASEYIDAQAGGAGAGARRRVLAKYAVALNLVLKKNESRESVLTRIVEVINKVYEYTGISVSCCNYVWDYKSNVSIMMAYDAKAKSAIDLVERKIVAVLADIVSKVAITKLHAELNAVRRNWKRIEQIMLVMQWCTRRSDKKWLRNLWTAASKYGNIDNKLDKDVMKVKNVIYAMVNFDTKRFYIGATTQTLMERYRAHMYTSKEANRERHCYKYINSMGAANWAIIPLQVTRVLPDSTMNFRRLLATEQWWMKKYRDSVINDKGTFTIEKKKASAGGNHEAFRRLRMFSLKKHKNRSTCTAAVCEGKWKEYSFRHILKVLKATKTMNKKNNVRKVAERKAYEELRRRGISLKRTYMCNVPEEIRLDIEMLRGELKKMMAESGVDKHVAGYIARSIRVNYKCSKTIRGLVHNSKAHQRNIVYDIPNSLNCTCLGFHDMKRNSEGHVHMKATDLTDGHKLLRSLLLLNSRTPVEANNTRVMETLANNLNALLRELKVDCKASCVLDKVIKGGVTGRITEHEVRSAVAQYKDLVFTELDKNVNAWCICCPTVYEAHARKNFSSTVGGHYERVYKGVSAVEEQLKVAYQDMGLHKVAQHRGDFKINQVRVNFKNKDINKARAITSCFGAYGKKGLKLASRALMVLIKTVRRYTKHMELVKTQEVYNRVKAMNRNKYWTERFRTGNVTMLEYDIKEQFTNLDKKEVERALDWAFELVRKNKKGFTCFGVHKSYLQKHMDGVLAKNTGSDRSKKNMHLLSLEQIRKFVEYEINNAYVEFGGVVLRQVKGLPIGAILSAPLACLDTMWKEHNLIRFRSIPGVKVEAFRFRDDSRYIIGKRINDASIKAFTNSLQKMYGSTLKVECEGYGYTSSTFLDNTMRVNNKRGQLEISTNNKVYEKLIREESDVIKRLPEVVAKYDSRVYIGVMYSQLLAVGRRVNNDEALLCDSVKLVIEWVKKGYSLRWIDRAVLRRRNLATEACLKGARRAARGSCPPLSHCVGETARMCSIGRTY